MNKALKKLIEEMRNEEDSSLVNSRQAMKENKMGASNYLLGRHQAIKYYLRKLSRIFPK